MKLSNSIVLILVSLVILTTSCNNRKTYADRLRDETKAIDLFIAKNDIEVLREFPANGIFDKNEFLRDPASGVYFNIIEYGDTTVRPQWRQNIYVRFKGLQYFSTKDTTTYSNHQSRFPEVLEYFGPVNSATLSAYSNSTAGWAVPLSYIGHTGRVKLIVPFEMGSLYDKDQFTPTYYEQVVYRFDNQW